MVAIPMAGLKGQQYSGMKLHWIMQLISMKKTIVAIFEDDAASRFIYENLAGSRNRNIEIHIFSNPAEGIEMARKVHFDIVYIEIHFWESFGGISILNKLRAVTPENMVAVATSSLLQEGDLEKITAAGFQMCLEKPEVFSIMESVNFPCDAAEEQE